MQITFLGVIIAVLVFGLIIFVHELGHFTAAKASGMKVNEFALGMGPRLLSFQRGETVYALRLLPVGGFVSVEGEDESSDHSRSFGSRKLWQRFVFVAAGACMNLLLGFILAVIYINGYTSLPTTVIDSFREGAVSSETLQVGDEIRAINGRRIYIADELQYELLRDDDGIMDFTIIRDGRQQDVTVTFLMEFNEDQSRSIYRDFWMVGNKKTVGGVLGYSFRYAVYIGKLIWVSLIDLVAGRVAATEMMGPVGVTTVIGQAASVSWRNLVLLMTMFSINVGIFNLLPIPALDGGRLLFLIIEAIRRKPIKPEYEGYIHLVGFALIILLLIYVTYNDILRLVQG